MIDFNGAHRGKIQNYHQDFRLKLGSFLCGDSEIAHGNIETFVHVTKGATGLGKKWE